MNTIRPDAYRQVDDQPVHLTERFRRVWARAFYDYAHALSQGSGTVVIAVGLPGAGKTTWFEDLASDEYGHLGFDALNLVAGVRSPLIHFAKGLGWDVAVAFFDVPWHVCSKRNADRTGDSRVPHHAMIRYRDRMEQPTFAEGLRRILYIDKDGQVIEVLENPRTE